MHAALEQDLEAALLELQGFDDERFGAPELGVCEAHHAREHRHQAIHDRVARAHHVGVAHGTAHDPAQHVAAALVGGQHAVRDQEGGAAQMVGDDAVADPVRSVRVLTGRLGTGEDEGAQRVDVVVVVLALQDGGDALEAHAGVDRGARQGHAGAGRAFLVLHEDEVPDLDETVAILIGAAGRAAGNVVAVVVEDLGARAARAGVAHAPEIVRGRDADDARVRQAGDPAPEIGGLVVLAEDGDAEPVLRQAELARDEGPGMRDRLFLEIVAEGEIPQHFKEGVMAGGVADIVEVVVLAAGTHAFLGGGGAAVRPLLLAGEDVLELDHAAVGEQQRGVVTGNERGAFDDLVVRVGEVVEEGGSDVVAAGHEGDLAQAKR